MNIKIKLLSATLGLCTLVGIISYMTITLVSERKEDAAIVNLAGRQRMLTQKMTKELMVFQLNAGQDERDSRRAADQVHSTMKIFDMTLSALKESGKAPLSLDLQNTDFHHCPKAEGEVYNQLQAVQKTWGDFSAKVNQVLDSKGTDQAALTWILTNNVPLLKEMNVAVGLMQRNSEAKIDSLVFWLTILFFVGLAFAAIAVTTIMSILKRLDSVKEFASRIGSGDLVAEISSQGDDELGVIVQELQNMAENLRNVFSNVKKSAGELDGSSQKLSAVSQQLLDNSGMLNDRSGTVASATEKMTQNMSTVSASAEQSTENMKIISTSTNELNLTVSEIAQNAEKARDITTQAVTKVGQTSESLDLLDGAAKQIDKVVETITEISEQTKLLALNATIEAARAGEAGKGFAVVANEVKELARQTSAATEDIREKIAAMQQSAVTTVDDIKEIRNVIQNVNDAVNNIATAVAEQSITTSSISDNILEASKAIEFMNGNIFEVADSSQMISSDISNVQLSGSEIKKVSSEITRDANSLSSMSSQLNKLIDTFKLN